MQKNKSFLSRILFTLTVSEKYIAIFTITKIFPKTDKLK